MKKESTMQQAPRSRKILSHRMFLGFAVIFSFMVPLHRPVILPVMPTGEMSITPPEIHFQGQIGGDALAVAVDNLGYVYAGYGPRMFVYTTQNYPDLAPIGSTPAFTDTVSGVAVSGQIAYVIEGDTYRSDGNWTAGRLHIFNVSSHNHPVELSSFSIPGKPTGIAIGGSYVFISETDHPQGPLWVEGGLRVVDVSDPRHPSEVGFYDSPGFSYGLAYNNNYVYLADGGSGMLILDVSNLPTISLVGTYDSSQTAYAVIVENNYAYLADGYDGLIILNISNKSSPQVINSVDTGEALGVSKTANTIVVADGSSGVVAIDVSTPTAPQLKSSYNTPGKAWQIATQGQVAYVADEGGIRIISLININSISEVGSHVLPYNAQAVRVAGNYAYVSDGSNGFFVIDISDPTQPMVAGSLNGGVWGTGLAVWNGRVYLGRDGVLTVVNVGTPALPYVAGSASSSDTPNGIGNLVIANGYAYVAAGLTGFKVFSLIDPDHPSLVGNLTVSGAGIGVAMNGSYAYLGAGLGGLLTINIGTPTSPVEIGHWTYTPYTQSYLRDVELWSNFAYVVDSTANIIRTINVGDPSNPTWQADTFVGDPGQICIQNNRAYLSTLTRVIVADFDVDDSLVELDSYQLPGGATDIYADNNYFYATGKGLWIFWYGVPSTATIPATGGVLVSGTDSTQYSVPNGTFSGAINLTHIPRLENETPDAPVDLRGIGHWFEIEATYEGSGLPAQPLSGQTYTLTVQYTDTEADHINEETLGLYYWDGSRWVEEPTSQVNPATNTLTATPNHLSYWAVFSQQNVIFLPLLMR
jgi:hypothetical protein